MVNNEPIKAINETEKVPPPMDESWWEAVLAEEEASFKPAPPNRKPLPEAPASKPAAPRISTDLSSVDWEYATRLYQQDEVICLQVSSYNRGGLLVYGEKLQGFVPISHLIEMPGNMKEAEQEEMLASYLERRLQLKVIECDQERGRVVFSERAALAQAAINCSLI
jgi:small subunit ribosomal protein S1